MKITPFVVVALPIAYEDMPEKVVSNRANVSQAVIDQHYDRRTEREKMEQRREFISDQ